MDLFQQIGSILLVFALLGSALVALRKRGVLTLRVSPETKANRRLQVVERISLSPQHSLCLVRADDRLIVIATAPGSCQLLAVEGLK